MILKSFIADKNKNLLLKKQIYLIYGENEGLKLIFKRYIKRENEKAEILNLYQDEVIKDQTKLERNLNNDSLFSKNKIIFINEATDKIFQYADFFKNVDQNIKIYILASNLEKRSKLRSLFEKDRNYQIIACYKDNEIALSSFIKDELSKFKGLNSEAINLIIKASNLNRIEVMAIIKKIKIYFTDNIIKLDHIDGLLNLDGSDNFDELRDASFGGDKKKLEELLGRTILLQEFNLLYLNKLTTRITRLLEANHMMKNTNSLIETVNNMKPPIFWKDKDIFVSQLRKWNIKKLNKGLKELANIELRIKKDLSHNSQNLIKRFLINFCVNDTNHF